jgi:hypothetical protein
MNGNAFDLGLQLHNKKIQFILSEELWSKFTYNRLNLEFQNWKSIKYLKDDCSGFIDSEINKLPNDKGGLYLFYLPCEIIPALTYFPLYIGRAQKTNNQNLKKRVKEYFQHYANDDERPKIYRMLRTWGSQIRVAYLELEDNQETINLEEDIINSLLLPMNDKIPDKTIGQAVKAFES